MTALKARLLRQIGQSGPMSVASYFAACLFDPAHGYYTTREPFGRGGDFITAPEISQMFGEMLAIWAFRNWDAMGRPAPFTLAEIGPGRGTLMADMARTLDQIEGGALLKAAGIVMIEASPRLALAQQERLARAAVEACWTDSATNLPDLPLIIIGNELFDAIPVHQYVKKGRHWHERMVTLAADEQDLAFALGASMPDLSRLRNDASGQPDGTILEIAPARTALMDDIAARIARLGGAGLFIDYGSFDSGYGDTLQAVRNHAFDDVLSHPGEADLTSHVDFAALAGAAQAAGLVTATATQGAFLLNLGLLERAGALGAGKDEATQERIRSEAERLAHPDQMGDLFKVLAIGKTGRFWMPG